MTAELVLVGSGGLAREALNALRDAREQAPIGFVDDDPALHGTTVAGLPVLGGLADAAQHHWSLVLCAGSGRARRSMSQRLADMGVTADRYVSIVHPSVSIPTNCHVGPGSILLAGVVLTADVTVGVNVVAMPNSVLTHDVVVEECVTLCAGVALGGGVTIEHGAYLGMNSCVRENLTVGSGAVLGMGSVALENIPRNQTWGGAPAVCLSTRPHDLAGRKAQ